MSEEKPPVSEPDFKSKKPSVEKTVLRPYPKVVFFYLTYFTSLIAGIVTAMKSGADPQALAATQETWTYIFLWVFTFNLLVVSFEFSRMLSVSVLFLVLAFIFLGLWLGFLSKMFGFLKDIHPRADHHFFLFVFCVFTVIYILVFIQTRFNYWVVRKNELLHKHGFLGDVKRYHAQNVKIDKEIGDIFEFILLRSGAMVLYPENEARAIVLENIIGINRKEKEVKEILESYAIRIDRD